MLSGDTLGFRIRVRIVERAHELRNEQDDSLALAIVNRLAESFKSK